eukprot:TRINITY_DN5784_c0_g1_i2.p1 TRINITY_DN5784_c0_g1~~TRINITY_DN5784_c0_g1_i2.p1  ORF type:complete len:254 (-),score=35.33 TRINITY_DN5784_c0_g1_i2:89-850(-)
MEKHYVNIIRHLAGDERNIQKLLNAVDFATIANNLQSTRKHPTSDVFVVSIFCSLCQSPLFRKEMEKASSSKHFPKQVQELVAHIKKNKELKYPKAVLHALDGNIVTRKTLEEEGVEIHPASVVLRVKDSVKRKYLYSALYINVGWWLKKQHVMPSVPFGRVWLAHSYLSGVSLIAFILSDILMKNLRWWYFHPSQSLSVNERHTCDLVSPFAVAFITGCAFNFTFFPHFASMAYEHFVKNRRQKHVELIKKL